VFPFLIISRPSRSPLFPYTTLFRSIRVVPHRHAPAGEVGERRTERLVDRLEGGAAQVLIGHGAPYSSRGGRRRASAAHGTRSRRPVRHLSVSQAHHTVRARPLVHACPGPRWEPGASVRARAADRKAR